MRGKKSSADLANQAQVGDEVVYHGDHNNLVRGLVADRAISPLSGCLCYRIVDSWSEAKDPNAGRWIGHDKLFANQSTNL